MSDDERDCSYYFEQPREGRPLPPGEYLFPRCAEAYFASGAYKAESTEYSNMLGPCLWYDLIKRCALLRERWRRWDISHKVDGPMVEFPKTTKESHKWDLVAGPRATTSPRSRQKTPRERLSALYCDFRDELRGTEFASWYNTPEHPVRGAHLAVEMKASIGKSNIIERYRSLDLDHRWAHEHDRRTLVVAITIVNAADVSTTQNILQTLFELPIRSNFDGSGVDANIIVPCGRWVSELRMPERHQYGHSIKELLRRYPIHYPG